MPVSLTLPRNLRVDDFSIASDLVVWRMLDPQEAPVDPATGRRKIMSSVFKTEEMSVLLSDEISLAQVQSANVGAFAAQFTAGLVRSEGCIIVRDPNNAAHGLVYDAQKKGDQRISRGQAQRIRDGATLIIP